jgi:SOS-response transcriptional repressor LexA
MNTLAERLLKSIDHAGLKQDQVAAAVNVTQQAIQHIISGETKRPKYINDLAHLLKVKPEWLMFGAGQPPLWAVRNEKTIPEGWIPILKWDEIEEWVKNGTENLDMSEDKRVLIANPIGLVDSTRKFFAVSVENDSMVSPYPNSISFLPNLTYLIAEPSEKAIPGDYAIIHKKGSKEAYFRKILKEGGKIFLKPLNSPAYEKEELNKNILPLARVIEKREILIENHTPF